MLPRITTFLQLYLVLLSHSLVLGEGIWPDCSGPDNAGSCPLPLCPDCSLVDCVPEITQEDCPVGTVLERNLVFGGCCPACVQYLGTGDVCAPLSTDADLARTLLPCTAPAQFVTAQYFAQSPSGALLVPVVHRHACGPDTNCSGNTCVPKADSACTVAQATYDAWFESSTSNADCTTYDWTKRCDRRNGLFGPVQRKANGYRPLSREFCSDPAGKRLFGSAAPQNQDITCGCSRKHWELKQEIKDAGIRGRNDVTLHCKDNGNYEPLQCDLDRCWCVDERSGRATSGAVFIELLRPLDPNSMLRLLPCFRAETFGSQYLRRCESSTYGRARSKQKLLLHGVTWEDTTDLTCDPDGSFGLRTCDAQQCRCVDRNNQLISNYFTEAANREGMDCRCARDEWLQVSAMQCTVAKGNYQEVQTLASIEYCVDEDGFQKTGSYPNKSPIKCQFVAGTCKSRDDFCAATPALCTDDPSCLPVCPTGI